MRSRLGMAAWALAAGSAWAWVGTARAGDAPVENRVKLELRISGLSGDGCRIEIKPGHKACRFRAVEKTIDRAQATDPLKLEPIAIDARSLGADRDCSFSIVVHEPGRPAKTFRRGLRLAQQEPGQPVPVQTLKCYLNTVTIATKEDQSPARR
jgi:hypothetical protein